MGSLYQSQVVSVRQSVGRLDEGRVERVDSHALVARLLQPQLGWERNVS